MRGFALDTNIVSFYLKDNKTVWCKTYGLTLVTNNTRHFANIPGLALADWSAA
jgi:predicted nucleic acid-binding protein